jgi:hypothetical protein
MSETDDSEGCGVNNSICSDKKIILSEINMKNNDEMIKKDIIEIISDLFNNICQENKIKKKKNNPLIKSFISNNIPSISIKDYLSRLIKHSQVNVSTIILILIYIDRICKINHFFLTYYNIHKVLLAGFILAVKYNEDYYYSMIFYSRLGGVTIGELKKLEFEFFLLIRYNLYVNENLYDKYYNDLMSLKSDTEDEYESDESEEDSNDIIENKHNIIS